MDLPLKTPKAVLTLNTTYPRLMNAMRLGWFAAPAKDSSGDYVWFPADIARARAALDARSRKREAVTTP